LKTHDIDSSVSGFCLLKSLFWLLPETARLTLLLSNRWEPLSSENDLLIAVTALHDFFRAGVIVHEDRYNTLWWFHWSNWFYNFGRPLLLTWEKLMCIHAELGPAAWLSLRGDVSYLPQHISPASVCLTVAEVTQANDLANYQCYPLWQQTDTSTLHFIVGMRKRLRRKTEASTAGCTNTVVQTAGMQTPRSGFTNPNNATCYLGALLQSLFCCDDFVSLLRTHACADQAHCPWCCMKLAEELSRSAENSCDIAFFQHFFDSLDMATHLRASQGKWNFLTRLAFTSWNLQLQRIHSGQSTTNIFLRQSIIS